MTRDERLVYGDGMKIAGPIATAALLLFACNETVTGPTPGPGTTDAAADEDAAMRADIGTSAIDAGFVDSGGADTGLPRLDAGVPRLDAGLPRLDGGGPRVDAGGPRLDGSIPGRDSAIPPLDGSIPRLDGAWPGWDGTLPQWDGSLPRFDAGAVQTTVSFVATSTPVVELNLMPPVASDPQHFEGVLQYDNTGTSTETMSVTTALVGGILPPWNHTFAVEPDHFAPPGTSTKQVRKVLGSGAALTNPANLCDRRAAIILTMSNGRRVYKTVTVTCVH